MSALEMLRSTVDFQRINGESRSRAHPALLMRYRRNELDRTRYGISTGRRVGTAVVRNGVRRRLRTILRRLEGQVQPGWDILLVARPAAAQTSQADLDQALTRMMGSAGLLKRETTGTN
ncbi:MAG: ribonuclease P protein component [Chloroflexota bacterium]